MARPVALRVSLRDDAAFFLRLEAAVEKDDRQPATWKKEAIKKLRDLANHFLNAPNPTPVMSKAKDKAGK